MHRHRAPLRGRGLRPAALPDAAARDPAGQGAALDRALRPARDPRLPGVNNPADLDCLTPTSLSRSNPPSLLLPPPSSPPSLSPLPPPLPSPLSLPPPLSHPFSRRRFTLEFSFPEVWETLAAAIPDREALVFRDRRLTLGASSRAHAPPREPSSLARGLGVHRERSARSPATSRARTTSRSTSTTATSTSRACSARSRRASRRSTSTTATSTRSSLYLLDERATRARSSTTPSSRRTLARDPRPRCRALEVLLQVADDSGKPLLPGRGRLRGGARRGLAGAPPGRALARRPLHPLHRRHDRHAEGRALAPGGHLHRRLGGRAPDGTRARRRSRSSSSTRERRPCMRARRRRRRSCTAPRTGSRSSCCTQGGTVVIPDEPRSARPARLPARRSSARRSTSLHDRRRRVRAAAARRAARRRAYDLSSLHDRRLGRRAALDARSRSEFLERFPHVMIIDGIGSSETGAQASNPSNARARRRDRRLPAAGRRRRRLGGPRARARSPATTRSAGSRSTGRVPLGYLGDAEKTARTFPVIDGVRYVGARRPRALPRRRHDRGARPRLGHDQLGRREDLRRGGRARAEAAPRRLRRRGRGPAERALGPGGRRGRRSCARARARREHELLDGGGAAPRALQAARRRSCSATRSCGARAARPTTAGRRPR